jgi:hypothetical protein
MTEGYPDWRRELRGAHPSRSVSRAVFGGSPKTILQARSESAKTQLRRGRSGSCRTGRVCSPEILQPLRFQTSAEGTLYPSAIASQRRLLLGTRVSRAVFGGSPKTILHARSELPIPRSGEDAGPHTRDACAPPLFAMSSMAFSRARAWSTIGAG